MYKVPQKCMVIKNIKKILLTIKYGYYNWSLIFRSKTNNNLR